MREDRRSTDLAGAAYYAQIFDGVADPSDDRPDADECRELEAEARSIRDKEMTNGSTW